MAAYRWYSLMLLLLCFMGSQAQSNRYIVYFKDKTNSPFSVTEPQRFLSFKSLERRGKQQIAILDEDIPVDPDYISGVRNLGAKTFYSSRWMNCLLIEADAATISSIQLLPYVSKTEFVAPGKKLSGGRTRKVKNKSETSAVSATASQHQQIGLDDMQNAGYQGENLMVAFFDSGFPGVNITTPFHALFQEGRIKLTHNFIVNSTNVYQYDDHGTEVFSVMAASSDGFSGGAPKANYMLFVTEDFTSEYRIEEFNWLFAAEKADSAGVDIINASVGYNLFDDPSMNYKPENLDGKTAIVTQAAQKAISKGIVVLCSAGNEGGNSWQYITPPADAQGILAIGSITQQFSKSSFSSIGPSSDGRVKPDVVALGSGTAVIKANGSIGSNSGTSFASPLVASLVAGIWQAYPDLSAKEIYEAIIRSADQALNPDNEKGYGLPNFNGVKNYLEAKKLSEWILIHPNPVLDDAIVITLKDPTGEPLEIIIYDIHGRVIAGSVLSITWQNNPLEYSLSGLAAGIYFIRAKGKSGSRIVRIAKL